MNEIIGIVGLTVAVVCILLSAAVGVVIESQYNNTNTSQTQGCRPNQMIGIDMIIEDGNRRHVLVSDVRMSEFSSGEYRHGGWGHDARFVASDEIDITDEA